MRNLKDWDRLMNDRRVLIELARDHRSSSSTPDEPPQPVYRYRPPNLDWLRDILEAHQLHLSSPADQNDIHEFRPDLPRFESEHEVRTFARTIFNESAQLYATSGVRAPLDISSTLNWHPATSMMLTGGAMAERVTEEHFVALYRQGNLSYILEQQLLRVQRASRICCFSEDPISEPMWGNYANSLRGVAIEFTFPRHLLGKVEYALEKPRWPGSPGALDRIFLTKHASWSYEREWRICLVFSVVAKADLDPLWITGIVFGRNCHLSTVRAVLKMRQRGGLQHARCFRLERSSHGFGFQLEAFSPTNDDSLLKFFREDHAQAEMPFTYDPKTGRV